MKIIFPHSFFLLFLSALIFALPLRAETAFRLSREVDVPLLALGAGICAFGNYRYFHMEPGTGEPSKSDFLPWDRPFAGTHHPGFDLSSDIVLYGLSAAVLGMGALDFGLGNSSGDETLAFFVSALEIALWQNGLNYLSRSLKLWGRPEIYRSGADRSAGESWGSFYSGHTGAAFAAAVFGGYWFEAKHPDSPYTPLVWGAALSLSTAVGAMRLAAGKHSLSDVVVGAVVGAATSFAVLRLHRSSRVEAVALPGYVGVAVRF